ncbi:adenosylcobinamide-phosphate synthase CbiB [Indioceanicola profundi]|uniref:adenosylcobinamide-phosphate synthase CbiB n=1 Tax=Indioceanicola profundi TaxID=2220096 RepID=UPI000E6AD797|nr:adenosylcobinamide-phosphate synthase CbiB [Indioceanicola profundi]
MDPLSSLIEDALAHAFLLLLTALAVEAAFGYPDRLYRAIRHPVVWIGAVISVLDRGLNRPCRSSAGQRAAGVLAVVMLSAGAIAAGLAIQKLVDLIPEPYRLAGLLLEAIVAATLLAQRSLYRFVADVPAALGAGGLPAGRRAVAHIVGRNPESLDEAGVSRAAIESLAENFSDGVVAPAIWLLVGGLPGLLFYKAVNTADSMIGHRTPRHLYFGWAAARLDDLLNLPASRLTALLIAGAALFRSGFSASGAVWAAWRDAPRHRSPNAGWPEAAMAGALGLRLAGPRVYGETRVEDAWMGRGRAAATAADIRDALHLYRGALAILWLLGAAGVFAALLV